MNKEIETKAKVLNQWILQQDVVKEYQKYEALIQSHCELKLLETELKDLQKKIVNLKHQQEDCGDLIRVYQEKKKSFDENPLVYNYLILKQEVNDLLYQIQTNIQQQLEKKG